MNVLQALRRRRYLHVGISGMAVSALIMSFILFVITISRRLKRSQYKFVTAKVVSLNGIPDDGEQATGREITVEYEEDDCLCEMTVVRQHTYRIDDLLPLVVNKKTGKIADDNVFARDGLRSKTDDIIFTILGVAVLAIIVIIGGYDILVPIDTISDILLITLTSTGACLLLTALFGIGCVIYDKITYSVRAEGTILRGETKEVKKRYRVPGTSRSFRHNYHSYKKRKFYLVYTFKYGGKTYVTKDYDGTYSMMPSNRQYININMKNGKMMRSSSFVYALIMYMLFLAAAVFFFWLTVFVVNNPLAIETIRTILH